MRRRTRHEVTSGSDSHSDSDKSIVDAEGDPRIIQAKLDFRWYWFGQSISVIGNQIAVFILPTIAIVLFKASGIEIGLLNAVSTAAYPLFGLFAGVLMDRVRRRPAMITADIARALVFAWVPVAGALGVLGMADLYVVALAAGTFGVLFDVASQSHLPTLLPDALLPKANSRMEISMALAMLSGPALGGLLVQLLTATTALVVTAASFLLSMLTIARLRMPEPPAAPRKSGSLIFTEIRAGIATLWQHPLLRPVSIAAGLRNLGNTAAATVALLFAYQVLHLSPGTVGVLFTVGGVAGLLGAWMSSRMVSRLGVGRTLIITCVSGGAWLAAPVALWLPAIPTFLAVGIMASLWLPVWNATITTLRQTVTPPELLGRVHATARTINFCAVPLGALVGGACAEVLSSTLGSASGLSDTLMLAGFTAASGAIFLTRSEVRTLRGMPPRLTPCV